MNFLYNVFEHDGKHLIMVRCACERRGVAKVRAGWMTGSMLDVMDDECFMMNILCLRKEW